MSAVRALLCCLPVLLTACGGGGGGDADAGPGDDAMPDADGGPTGGFEVVTCPDPAPAPTSGICDATAGSGSATLFRGDVLGVDTVYEGGSLLVDGDQIACVGCDCSGEAGFADATQIACGTAVISPALINGHDHVTYNNRWPIVSDTRYDHRHEWRDALSTPSNQHGTGFDSAGMRWNEIRHVLAGTATMVGSGRADGLLRNLDRLETEDRDAGFAFLDYEVFNLGDGDTTFRANCDWNYSNSKNEVANLSSFVTHTAEGIDDYAAEEFRCQSSSFDGGQDFVESNTTHIHLIGLTAADWFRVARDDAKLSWAPRSNISLYGITADAVTFHRLGGTLNLGPDWTYSGSANLLRELACARAYSDTYQDGYFSDYDLWRMVTIDAARTTASDTLIGSLEVGKLADIAIFAADAGEHHGAIVSAENADVALTMKEGEALYGETDVLEALGESCDAIDICGETRALCAAREFDGATWASIEAEVTGADPAYPAVFCGAPPDEPTCVPMRPGEFTGEITATDSDGDGIADADDNCPRNFNPIRPLDGGSQSDADGDGVGDPCDTTPIGDDLDGDSVANQGDNCPFDSNTAQDDGDTDGKGDACDFCPDQSNPDTVCPIEATTITAIQTGAVPVGAPVRVENVVVTAVWDLGAFVQDPNAGSPANSGVNVFVGSDPGVSVGDVVHVDGAVEEYFMLTEIDNASITPTGSTDTIAPTPLTVAEAATEPYEGVLVTLTDATVTDPAYDCSVDGAQCMDALLWEVNSAIVVYNRYYQDGNTSWSDNIGTVPVTGVMSFRWERRRIVPRTAADFGN